MASIRTAGLTKDIGDLRTVTEIDLDLPEGNVAGFVGPNGAVQQRHIRMLFVTEPYVKWKGQGNNDRDSKHAGSTCHVCRYAHGSHSRTG